MATRLAEMVFRAILEFIRRVICHIFGLAKLGYRKASVQQITSVCCVLKLMLAVIALVSGHLYWYPTNC